MKKGNPCDPGGIRVIFAHPWRVLVAGGALWAGLAAQASAVPPSESVAFAVAAENVEDGPEGASRPEGAPQAALAAVTGLSRIENAWHTPAASLDDRVTLTRRAALELGIWNLDVGARTLLASEADGEPLARARAAVRLAPDLPAARMALAHALWLEGDSPIAALRAAFSALVAIPRHLEASLWFGGSLLFVLGMSFVFTGLWSIALMGGAALRRAAHDLGDFLPGEAPRFARAALLASLLLVPVALGEGLLGLVAGFAAAAIFYGGLRQRLSVVLAAALFVLGAYPTLQLAGATLFAFFSDPVAEAAISTAQGFDHPVDRARLVAAAGSDPLAARALAMRARRAGTLGEADAHYQRLLREAPGDPVVANNAANVRLNLGHMESAQTLYRRSIEIEPNPIVLFNLSQAHGRAFQMDELSTTLAEAQRLDVALIAELTALQGADTLGFVVDQPLETELIWQRILRSTQGDRMAGEIRRVFAPGRLGSDSLFAIGVFGVIALVFGVLGGRVSRAHRCLRCGKMMCARCDPDHGGTAVCAICKQLFQQTETTDRELRLARIDELRAREERLGRAAVAASVFVPGAAGLLAGRPVRCLSGSFFAVLALLALFWRDGVVPDPMVAGAAASFAGAGIAAVATIAYFVVVVVSLATRRNA
jgi:tetratricopeptide (TPR) repeat protein